MRCAGLAGPKHGGRDPPDRIERGNVLSLAAGARGAEERACKARLKNLELENSRLLRAVSDLNSTS